MSRDDVRNPAGRCLVAATCALGACAVTACSPTPSRHGSRTASAAASHTADGAAPSAAPKRPQLAAKPVVVKFGTTFEVRVKFRRALPTNSDRTGARANFSLGPSDTDHAPVRMRGSRGFCYRQTLYNDFDKPVLRHAHAGSTLTLKIVVHGEPPAITRRVKLTADDVAVPPGCALHQGGTG